MTVFWDITPYSLVDIGRRFRGAYCLHHQGDRRDNLKSHKLRVFENSVQRTIFGHKREAVTVGRRKLRKSSFKIYAVHQKLLGDQIEEDEMGGACSFHG
jgi:hypothetical protein